MRKIHLSLMALSLFALVGTGFAHAADAAYNTSTFLGKLQTSEKKAPLAHYVDQPEGFDIAENGKIVIADTTNHDIKVINAAGTKMRTLAGTHRAGLKNGPARTAQFNTPRDVEVKGAKGKVVFIADTGNNAIRKIKKNGKVITLADGLSSPSALYIEGTSLYVADTGNDRILKMNTKTGSYSVVASGDEVSGVHELIYWKKHKVVIFANDTGEIRSVNTKTGKVSKATISGFDNIGGITRNGRNLYIASSTDIGVFNQIMRYAMKAPNANKVMRLNTSSSASFSAAGSGGACNEVTPAPQDCENTRETESLNNPSDIEYVEETETWEDANSWDTDERYSTSSLIASGELPSDPDSAACLDFGELGEDQEEWKDLHYVSIDTEKAWQTAEYEVPADYQGDDPFFRVTLEYTGEDEVESNEGETTSGYTIDSVDALAETRPSQPENFVVTDIAARSISFSWDREAGTDRYFIQLLEDGEEVKKYGAFEDTGTATIADSFVNSNTAYTARIFACSSDGSFDNSCGNYSDEISFRTLAPTVSEIADIKTARGINISELDNGNFGLTLKFKMRQDGHNTEDLRAKVQLCSESTDHADTVDLGRLYVTYTGGSSLMRYDADGFDDVTHIAGENRYLNRFGKKKKARPGRPKDIVFSPNGKKMYVSQNNKLAVYNYNTKKYTELAGNVMDSYTEETGSDARFSDPSGIDIAPGGKWLYVADRNNHRIRKVNTKTGKTKYITGAGPVNYSFKTTDATYQEGAACSGELELGNSSCAYFNRPTDVAVTSNNKFLYVADASNNRIRRVNISTGKTKLVAGSGSAGFSNGVGSSASFNGPYSITLSDDDSTLYVADKYNHAIRAIDLATNTVSTVTGTGSLGLRDGGTSVAVLAIPEYVHYDSSRVYWTEAGSHTIRYVDLTNSTVYTVGGQGDSGFANGNSSQTKFNNPKGIGVRNGKLFVADYYSDLIRRIVL